MFFEKRAVGLEIGREGIKFASLTHAKGAFRLNSFATAPLPPESVKFSFREPNVLDVPAFATVLKAAYLKLLEKTTRVSVSLPDSVGRVLLVDVDSRFKSKEEGADIILWKLRKNSTFELERTHLDYQVLGETETGALRVLAAFISRPVVNQYEEILQTVGLEPYRIDFTSFNLYHLFSRRLEMTPNSVITSVYGPLVTIMIFRDGILDFFRTKELNVGNVRERLFQEINNSLLAYREKNSAFESDALYCFTHRDGWEELRQLVSEAAGAEPRLLVAESLFSSGEGSGADANTAYMLAAPLGAAARSL